MANAPLPFPLVEGRAHEVCGAGAYSFAFALAAARGGQVLWVRETWEAARINPDGFAEFINPADLLLCNAPSQIDALAATEEALRSGAVALVVVSLTKPLGLTEGRRLQLAAKEGKSIGLALIPEGMGSNAAETRWRCSPHFDAAETSLNRPSPSPDDSTLQRWELIKNKSGTLGVWYVRWDRASRRLAMVSPAGK
ncbi:ImuA family protein [Ruegeria sp. TM1040]|jgi:protein ImuA|uniref:ImuA family protein n=1 Tax=Rhodobacterales TaxID=204455 RepID=UPI0000462908|nr:hypothetical protein [Ruegeria sp. TM1040]ABF62910.1 hypothetical protein TM1040_0177 [Ruegeria sp. TM1040]